MLDIFIHTALVFVLVLSCLEIFREIFLFFGAFMESKKYEITTLRGWEFILSLAYIITYIVC